MPSHADDGLRLSRAIYESLDSIVAPSVRDRVLSSALVSANLPAIPGDAEAFDEFVAGPLRTALHAHLGRTQGDALFEQLSALAQTVVDSSRPPTRHRSNRPPRRSSSPTIRRSSPPQRSSPPPRWIARSDAPRSVEPPISSGPQGAVEPASRSYPAGMAKALRVRGAGSTVSPDRDATLLLCTADGRLAERFRAWVDDRAIVIRIQGVVNLLYALEDARETKKVIIIDCRTPGARPHSVATLAEELPPDVQVVLWGATTALVAELVKLSPVASKWMVCPDDVRERVVAEHCIKLANSH